MFSLKKSFALLSAKVLAGSLALVPVNADACTRVVYLGPNANVITARSMDWNADIGTNLWIFPKGMERSGEAGRNSLRWTSKYGSVIASGFDVSTTDGLNEAGLCANLLWLAESQYPAFDQSKPGLSVAAWAQYVLDNSQPSRRRSRRFAASRSPLLLIQCPERHGWVSTKTKNYGFQSWCAWPQILRRPIFALILRLHQLMRG